MNWDLFDEFAALIAAIDWDVALFQEFPPSWKAQLARACGAEAHRALSGRNWLQPLTSIIGRWRPDLLGAWEGGSNTTLVRRAAGGIAERRRGRSHPEARAPCRWPSPGWQSGLCVANLHVSTKPSSAERELLGRRPAGDRHSPGSAPLIFGGDFNVRPKASEVFDQLEERFGLAPRTAPDRLSHLLVRGLESIEHPAAWPPEARDVADPDTGLKIRLADHNPVAGKFATVG